MTETFSYDRASFAERAAKLAGQGTFREPTGSRGTKHDHVPDEHSIASSFSIARKKVWSEALQDYIADPNDISVDIAVAISTGCIAHADKIVRELAVAIFKGLGFKGPGHTEAIYRVSAGCYLRAMGVKGTKRPEGITDKQYQLAVIVGESALWQLANEALFRAERAYRIEPRCQAPRTRLQPSFA